jgi:molybdopterin converting factor small subunit
MAALVRLHLTLIEMAGGKKELHLDAKQPVLLPALLESLGVSQEEVGIIVRNRKRVAIDSMIQDGDVVELFPILSGG